MYVARKRGHKGGGKGEREGDVGDMGSEMREGRDRTGNEVREKEGKRKKTSWR